MKSLRAYKLGLKGKTVVLLIPFLSIFLINSVCSFQSLLLNDQNQAVANIHPEENHSHQHEGDNAHSHAHQGENISNKDQQEDDGCCDDMTTLFFSQVFPPPDFVFYPIINQFIVPYSYMEIVKPETEFIRPVNPDLILRQKIPDIRILIQSFQI